MKSATGKALAEILDEVNGLVGGADPRFVSDLRKVVTEIDELEAQEEKRVAKLPKLTQADRDRIAARRAARADRNKGVRRTW